MEQHSQQKPIEIYFLRHGETLGNKDDVVCSGLDVELSEKGRNQAIEENKLYNALINAGKITNKIPVISTSKKRALDTAKLFTGKNDFEIDDGFTERSFGRWDGTLTNYLNDELGSKFTPPEGENFATHQERLKPILEKYIEKAKHKPVIIASHNGTMRRIANMLIGREDIIVENARLYCARSLDGGNSWDFKKLSLGSNNEIIEEEPKQRPPRSNKIESILKDSNNKTSLKTEQNGSSIFKLKTSVKTSQQQTKEIAESLGKAFIGNHHRALTDTTTKIKFPDREISITLNPMQTEILQAFAKEKNITISPPQIAR